MKKILYIVATGAILLTGCKSQKNYTSWENVYDTPTANTTTTTPVTVVPVQTTQQTAVMAPVTTTPARSESVTITHGTAEKYCIVVGSFGNVDNATRLMNTLKRGLHRKLRYEELKQYEQSMLCIIHNRV